MKTKRFFRISLVLICLFSSACQMVQPTATDVTYETTSSITIPNDTITPLSLISPTTSVVPAFGIGSTWIRPADAMTMMYVPEGNFFMGGTLNDDMNPVHQVYLDAYWIDQTEVTNGMYAKCVQAGVCQAPSITKSWTRGTYYDDPQYANFPVIWVRWGDAKTYCSWAGGRLPTEAEWENAAHGTRSGPYPWGYPLPDSDHLNFNFSVGDTTTVGSYPPGNSRYGVQDMAGNVWEFVADWYSATYYSESPASNPQGPVSGTYKVIRGGSYTSPDYMIRSDFRNSTEIMVGAWDYGFRCALPANALVSILTPTATPGEPTLADFFQRCPTAAEVADVNAKLIINFVDDPTAGTLVCNANDGSADLTYLEKKAYQTIISMRYLQFSQPLPWADKPLYDWFTGAITGIDFIYASGPSSCCVDGRITIKVRPESYILTSDVWVSGLRGVELFDEPGTGGSWGGGLLDTVSGYIHEARHNEGNGYPHMCESGPIDVSLLEMGAYGVQYYFHYWLANYSDRVFLRAPGEDPNIYLVTSMYDAYWMLKHKFCSDPTPTPGPIPTIINPIQNP